MIKERFRVKKRSRYRNPISQKERWGFWFRGVTSRTYLKNVDQGSGQGVT